MKFVRLAHRQADDLSLPVRGAWIEMVFRVRVPKAADVAPRKGSVD